jgi:cell fate regulator YaaT (PSP1 superfamily)
MACSGCASGRGCHTTPGSVPAGCNDNGSCGTGGCNKLNVFDWLSNMALPGGQKEFDVVEIRFKNSRKEYFRNVNNISLGVGEVVAVEGTPGHDIGVVSATGELVRLQMRKKNIRHEGEELKKLYRKAKPADIDKWREAQTLEVSTMFRARTLALNLGLQMKISDVEYQGDKTKAIFYYTADERVDFRELIKVMADEFRIRIEMKQIGARQEAGRLGGIGSCGRELCCSTWLTDFRSVSTAAARYQQLSLNPMKLAGQCGKLKCCLNYELDSYVDALKDFPETDNVKLKSKKGNAFHQKTDIFRRIIWYSYEGESDVFIPLPVNRVKEVMAMNARGEFPDELLLVSKEIVEPEKKPDYENVVGQDSLTRFDRSKKQQQGGQNKGRNKQGPQKNQPRIPQQQNQQKNPQSKTPNEKGKQAGPNPNKQNNQRRNNRNNPNRRNPNRPNNNNPSNKPPAP